MYFFAIWGVFWESLSWILYVFLFHSRSVLSSFNPINNSTRPLDFGSIQGFNFSWFDNSGERVHLEYCSGCFLEKLKMNKTWNFIFLRKVSHIQKNNILVTFRNNYLVCKIFTQQFLLAFLIIFKFCLIKLKWYSPRGFVKMSAN